MERIILIIAIIVSYTQSFPQLTYEGKFDTNLKSIQLENGSVKYLKFDSKTEKSRSIGQGIRSGGHLEYFSYDLAGGAPYRRIFELFVFLRLLGDLVSWCKVWLTYFVGK